MCVCVCVYTYIYHIFFIIHSSIDGHLDCFFVLAIVNSAAMNIGVHVSFQITVFIFSKYLPRSGIAGLYGNSVFHYFKETPCCFPQWLHQFTFSPAAPFSPHPLQHLLFIDFLMMAILTSVRINNMEHLFVCLLDLCMPSLGNVSI